MPNRASFVRKKCIQFLVIAVFTVAAFATAHADPITVSGSAVITNGQFFGPSIIFNISGQNFQASNLEDAGGLDHFGNFGISPCSTSLESLNGICTSANLGYSGNGSDIHGNFTVNGQTFASDVVNTLSFHITSPTFVIPANLANEPSLTVTAPFTFTGVAGGACCQAVDLAGEGTVVLFLIRDTVGGFTGLRLVSAQYTFGETVPDVTFTTATPEPATIVLFLSGLAGAIVRLRQKGNRSQ